MILNKLTLSNFSAYGRKQTLDLAPKLSTKPIVLVGGLNGAGKTSILTAIRVALYGKRSITLEDSKSGYSKLLKSLVHNNRRKASIELDFCTYSYGDKKEYRIKREWIEIKGKIKEDFTVWYNGRKDKILTGTWDEYVDALLPASISHLFFFDGEKVSDFATSKGTADLLKVGVNSLLGIDLLQRLRRDLADLIHTKASKQKEDKLFIEIDKAKKNIEELEGERFKYKLKKGKLQNKIERLENQIVKQEQHLKEIGADLFLQRAAIEQDLTSAKSELKTITQGLVDIAASALPLSLVDPLLKKVVAQDQVEHKAYQSQLILEELIARDKDLLDLLDKTEITGVDKVKTFLTADIAKRAKVANTNCYLHMSDESRTALTSLSHILEADRKTAQGLLEQHGYWSNSISILKSKIQMIPPESTVAKEIAKRDDLKNKLQEMLGDMAIISRQIEALDGNIKFKKQERDRILKKDISLQLQHSEDQRIMLFAEKARERTATFEERLIHRSIDKLETIIHECTNLLFRKALFICDLKIDPNTYELLLFKPDGEKLPIDSLSSGERQILIIAVLWGLARASGKPLPLIVDTPLGRLDSEHRNNLVERYYSTASHQVVLLSTDTEIDANLLPQIEEHMSHSYLLEHNPSSRQTSILPGYFWS